MSHGNSDEMPQEVDFTGAVRGKYLARYQRWVGITTAVGAYKVNSLSTGGDPSAAKIVMAAHHGFHVSSIAPEVATGRT